jgi:hypothetical protein
MDDIGAEVSQKIRVSFFNDSDYVYCFILYFYEL